MAIKTAWFCRDRLDVVELGFVLHVGVVLLENKYLDSASSSSHGSCS